MSELNLGDLVQSTQGHDKGQLYLVVNLEKDKVLVCDGKFKLLKKPKQKNKHHLLSLNYQDSEIATKLVNGLKINDQMIYHAIVKYKKLIKEKMYG